jgi:hypothetical protein
MPRCAVTTMAMTSTGARAASSMAAAPRIPGPQPAKNSASTARRSARRPSDLIIRTAVYSSNVARAEATGFVPMPLQLSEKFALPTKVIVLPISWVQPVLELAPPANFTSPAGT